MTLLERQLELIQTAIFGASESAVRDLMKKDPAATRSECAAVASHAAEQMMAGMLSAVAVIGELPAGA